MNSIMNYVYTLVIVSVFLAILDMLLPKGNSKKYIKLVGGLVLVYIVISPIVNILFNVDDIDINTKSVFNDLSINDSEEFNQKKYIMNIFEEGVKTDIENIVRECGYLISNFEMKYNMSNDSKIQDITFVSFNMQYDDKSDKIRKVYINVNEKISHVSDEEKSLVKEKISNAYNISVDNVHIM